MVKKSRRQREGTERVYPYDNVELDQDVPGQNTDSVEFSSTMFQPEASNKSRGVLRLKKKTLQHNSSKLEGGSEDRNTGRSSPHHPPAMHAVANGERTEAFKSNGGDSPDSPPPLGETYTAVSKKTSHGNRPCPKSRKFRDSVEEGAETGEQTQDPEAPGTQAPEAPGTQAPEEQKEDTVVREEAAGSGEVRGDREEEPEQHVNGVADECNVGNSSGEPSINGNEGSENGNERSELGNEESELGNEESELGNEESELGNEESELGNQENELGNEESELGNEESELGNEESELGNEESELGNDESELGNEESELGNGELGNEGSEHENKGSELGNEEREHGNESSEHKSEGSEFGNEECEHVNEESEHANEESDHGNEGIVTEPEDHADQESCNMTEPDVTISFLEGEEDESDLDSAEEREALSAAGTSEPLIEFPADSPGKTPRSPDPDSDDPMTEDLADTSLERGYKVLHRLLNPTQYTCTGSAKTGSDAAPKDFSFGRSLRGLSGRPAMKPREGDEEASAPTEDTGLPTFFSLGLGKRKAEGVDREAKRAKPEQGVDSLGFFARLTSPVVDRLRAIKVGSPFRSAPREVTGHEEMAVALLPTAQPPSSRCDLM